MIKIATTTQEAKQLSREYQGGRLRRIYHGIYTDDLKSEMNQEFPLKLYACLENTRVL